MKSHLKNAPGRNVDAGCLSTPARSSRIIHLLAALTFAQALLASDVVLTAATMLVTPDQPTENETAAADLLQTYLRRAFAGQAGFEIVRESQAPAAGTRVLLGATRGAPDIQGVYRDGFVISAGGNQVAIRGGGDPGTFYGASRFLDRHAGIRFYLPGDLFTHVPSHKRIAVPEGVQRENPYTLNSMMSGTGGTSGTGGFTGTNPRAEEGAWLKRNAAFRKESVNFSHQHSMFQRFPPEKFAARWPEIYPILGGKRYIPAKAADQGWQPCLTEPKLIDAAIESSIEYFKANATLRYLSFSIQDSHKFCECPRCKAEVAKYPNKGAGLTALNARFLNAVAERWDRELPAAGIDSHKTLVYIAYSDVNGVPPFPLHRAILPVVVFTIGDALIDGHFEPGKETIRKWGAAVKQMGNHDWAQGHLYLIPRIYTGLTSRLFRDAKAEGLIWGYQHTESYPNWGLDGAKLWVSARIYWNPDEDEDALWRQFARDLFPGAAESIDRYFAILRELWIKMDQDAERKLRKWSNQFELRSEEQRAMARECRRLLDQAARDSRSDPERARVDLFWKSYRLTEYFFEFANTKTIKRARVEEARAFALSTIATNPMTVYTGGNPAEFLALFNSALDSVTKGKISD